jgi:prepilin-type N-terminal cleavage/methylation domain-containing protein
MNKNNGFTLIEILVVLTILILVAGFALFVSMDSYRGFSFRSERDTAVSMLQKARSQGISNICLGGSCADGKPHGVHFTSSQYKIFQGTSLDDTPQDAAVDQAVPVNNKVTITDTSNNPPADIIFNQLDGATTAATIRIKDTSGHSSDISVNSEGQIAWTN